MQDVKTNAAQSANIVKTTFLMKELENAAKAALAAAMESIEVAEKTCPDDENLINDCKAATVVAKVLEEKIDCFANNPSSSEAQSYLLIACKRFLDPTNRFIDTSKATLGNIVDENISLQMKETLDEAEISVNNLEAQVDKTESSLATLDTEAAAELIKSLRSELLQIKEDSQNSLLEHDPCETAEKSTSDLNKAAKSVRFEVDNYFNSAINVQREKLNKAAQNCVKELANFKAANRSFAANARETAKQEYIIDQGLAVLDNASILVSQAHKVVLNPANPGNIQTLSAASSKVAKSLNATLLANPDMVVMASNKLTKTLADEL